MTMNPFPEEHELIWLFECEPEVTDKGIPWAYNHLTFTTMREDCEVKCEIEPGYETVKLTWTRNNEEQVDLDFHWVKGLEVVKKNATEALVVYFRDDSPLKPVIIQLKPHVNVSVRTKPEL